MKASLRFCLLMVLPLGLWLANSSRDIWKLRTGVHNFPSINLFRSERASATIAIQSHLARPSMMFDPLVTDVAALQTLLTRGSICSEELARTFLAQIEQHNINGMGIRAIISVAPKTSVLERARMLDNERKNDGGRGPFHGIPVLIKDTFWTHPAMGMDTTCGTLALRGAKPPRNAAIVDMLLDAGMIIIGKANLSELALMKSSPPATGGWSSAGGQGQSPYVRGGVLSNATFLGHSTPCGSSSGSAAGVAAGFAPIGIGHETDGSIVQAGTRAALYSMKPSVGTVPLEGTMPVMSEFDSHGGLARSVRDLADMTGLLMGGKDFSMSLKDSWTGLRIGFVEFEKWQPASFVVEPNEAFKQQTLREIEGAKEKIKLQGGKVVSDVRLITLAEIGETEGGTDPDNLFGYDFRHSLESFLQGYDESPVRTLQAMVDYHRANAALCLPPDHPNQKNLEDYLEKKPMSRTDFEKVLRINRNTARDAIEDALEKNDIDAIIGFADARMASIAAVAGFAVGTLPLGFADFNGRAWGMNIITGENGEGKMLEVMSAWEKTFPDARKPPPLLVDWAETAKI